MCIDRNQGINAFCVELLGGYVAFFEILANVNGIGGCIGIPEDVCKLIATVSSVTLESVQYLITYQAFHLLIFCGSTRTSCMRFFNKLPSQWRPLIGHLLPSRFPR